jgi:glycosyltransferase involved in cell wall biosynthesis
MKLIWYKLPLLIANKVVCISEHTRQQILKLTNRKDIKVIYNSVDPSFQFNDKPFRKEQPVILQIGTAWNKNLLNTIKALTNINCHFVIVGEIDNEIQNILKQLAISFTNKNSLTDQEIIQEYKNCDIVSFCSLYEGFGMPIIEANAIGRAVITSSIPPMNEVATAAACLVDPTSIASIQKGFLKIITKDKFRESIISNGKENINKFEVSFIAKQYLNLYAKVNPIEI